MKISIFGTGYVWLVTGTCLAEVWHNVICMDIDQTKIDNLKKWIIPIYEPGLEELVLRNIKEWRLLFTTDPKEAVDHGEVVFNAVGTPPGEDGHADLTYVRAVAKTFGEYVSGYKVFVNKSTVPVGTGEMCAEVIQQAISASWSDAKFDVVSNPEFLKEGTAIKDFTVPDRIVCGISGPQAEWVMRDVYASFVRADKPLIITDVKSAELIKYAANSFLATKISFINEIANFAELVWANVKDVALGMWLDNRIGPRFLHAGIWYGGSCFPKDVKALVASGDEVGYDFKIIKATEAVNAYQKTLVIKKLTSQMPDLTNKTIAVRWVSFKPKTDDVRDAPSHAVFDALIDAGASVQAFDPVAMEEMQHMYEDHDAVSYTATNYEALQWVNALILLTERDEFRNVSFEKVKDLMQGNIIIDGRNIRNREKLENMWFVYEGIGK